MKFENSLKLNTDQRVMAWAHSTKDNKQHQLKVYQNQQELQRHFNGLHGQ